MTFDEFTDKLNILSHFYGERQGVILKRLLDQEIERIKPLLEKKNAGFTGFQKRDTPSNLSPLSHGIGNEQSKGVKYLISNTADLKGSKPIEIIFNNTQIEATSWKNLFHKFLVLLVSNKYCSSQNLLDSSDYISINLAKGVKSGRGYDYNDYLKLSIQGNAAPIIGEAIKKLCAKYEIGFTITVRWNSNAPDGMEVGYFSNSEIPS